VLYVANKNMSPKEAEAFSKLLTEMIGWSSGTRPTGSSSTC
jgi:hypothetical protein